MPVFSTVIVVVPGVHDRVVAHQEELGRIVALDQVRRHLDAGLEQGLLGDRDFVVELRVGAVARLQADERPR